MNYEIYELNTKISTLQILAQKSKKDNCTTKEIVSKKYYKYLLLFDKKKNK